MSRTGTANLGLSPVTPGDADYWNVQMTPAKLLGLQTGSQSRAQGAALPPVTATIGDYQQVWWSPDSAEFWLIVLAGAAVFGLAGLSVRFRAGPAKADASFGKS